MTKSDNENALNSLYQINKNLDGLSIANGLNYYLTDKINQSSETLKYLSLDCFDPLFCAIYNGDEDKSKYLQ